MPTTKAPTRSSENPSDWETVAEEEGVKWYPVEVDEAIEGTFEAVSSAHDPTPRDGSPDGRDFKIYKFRTDGGGLWGVYSSYKLDQAMENIEQGDFVRLIYRGKIDIGGGQDMRDWKVLRRKS
jgi:hypothetical protein